VRLLSELIGARVADGEGRDLGRVKDVLLVQDGPYVEGFGNALRVEGVLVGPGSIGARLGFQRSEVRGPWLLNVLFRRLERRASFYDWSAVARWDGRHVHLREAAEALPIPTD
jgi:hypothetical protein